MFEITDVYFFDQTSVEFRNYSNALFVLRTYLMPGLKKTSHVHYFGQKVYAVKILYAFYLRSVCQWTLEH